MDTSTQNIELVQQLVDRHFAIWNETNPDQWPALFAATYTPDLIVADYDGIATDVAGVTALLRRVQTGHAGFTFTPAPATWNHGLGRVTWGYGPRDNPYLVRGEDIFTIRDGKLASLHVFLEPGAAQAGRP